jgi:hypothetical protein
MLRQISVATAFGILLSGQAVAAPTFQFECESCTSFAYEITDPQQRAKDIAEMQSDLKSALTPGAQLTDCDVVVEVGRGYGGLCNLVIEKNSHKWMICGDSMFGNFAAVIGARLPGDPKTTLAQFTNRNCVGG